MLWVGCDAASTEIIGRDSPIGEGKHAVLKKGSGWTVDEVDNGFASIDKYLQEKIETYWYFKNLSEFRDLEHELLQENYG
jgi:hypothetical protein